MTGEPMPGPLDTEMRWATLPDGTRMLVSTRRGLSQDDVDLIAAEIWAKLPAE